MWTLTPISLYFQVNVTYNSCASVEKYSREREYDPQPREKGVLKLSYLANEKNLMCLLLMVR